MSDYLSASAVQEQPVGTGCELGIGQPQEDYHLCVCSPGGQQMGGLLPSSPWGSGNRYFPA